MFDLQNYSYEAKPVSVMIDKETGELLFDASQICSILGYERDTANVLERLDEDEKWLLERKNFDPTFGVGSKGGAQRKWFVNEPGLYTLILGSEKSEAKKFKRWVTHVVLPEIRKNGGYFIQQQTPKYDATLLEREAQAALGLAKIFGLEGNQAKIAAHNVIKNLYGIKPLMLLETSLINPQQERDFNASDLAKLCGYKSAQEVNKALMELGFQTEVRDSKQRIVWVATELAKQGNFSVLKDVQKQHKDGTPVTQLRWLERILPILREFGAKKNTNVLKLEGIKA